MVEELDRSIARRVALAAAVGFPPPYTGDAEGAAEFIRRVGYVQIDTISVVARAHEHVMWSRCGRFSAAPFAELEGMAVGSTRSATGTRKILEYWAHAASYLPIEDFRYSLPRMERIRRDGHEWFKADGEVAAEVLARVRAEGPLSSRDFEDTRGRAGSWWDWKPAKRALEYLFHAGELLVATRVGFNKVFDLAERVLPPDLDLRKPSEAEAASRYVDRAADAYGLFVEDEVAYGRKDAVEAIGAELASRVEAGRLARFRIEGCGNTLYYGSPATIEAAALPTQDDPRRPRVFVLSPFDPFLIDRRRVRRLFGLDYTIECYVPEAKRRFGYFSLPILDASLSVGGEGFVGLVDAKADRKARTLIVKRIALGASAGLNAVRGRGFADLAREVGRSLAEYGSFNGAERIVFDRVECPTSAASAALVKAAEAGFR
jgi:uncharacterized protein YcaQ